MSIQDTTRPDKHSRVVLVPCKKYATLQKRSRGHVLQGGTRNRRPFITGQVTLYFNDYRLGKKGKKDEKLIKKKNKKRNKKRKKKEKKRKKRGKKRKKKKKEEKRGKKRKTKKKEGKKRKNRN